MEKYVRDEEIDSSVWEDSRLPRVRENLGEKNGPSHSTECRQRLHDQMSNTSEGKTKLDEEQKRRDAFTARRMMSASHVPVAESQPCKRARIASEADSPNSTAMQDVATQGPLGADTASETNMRDSSKWQADAGVEPDTNDGGDEAATLCDDAEMGVESQGEQALGLSVVNVAQSKNSLRATQLKATVRSKESSIMNIASECPVTGTRYDFPKLEDRKPRGFPDCVPRDPYVFPVCSEWTPPR